MSDMAGMVSGQSNVTEAGSCSQKQVEGEEAVGVGMSSGAEKKKHLIVRRPRFCTKTAATLHLCIIIDVSTTLQRVASL